MDYEFNSDADIVMEYAFRIFKENCVSVDNKSEQIFVSECYMELLKNKQRYAYIFCPYKYTHTLIVLP